MNTKNYKKYMAILLVVNSFATGYAGGTKLETQEQQKQGWSNKQVACVVVPLAAATAALGLYALSLRGHLNQVSRDVGEALRGIRFSIPTHGSDGAVVALKIIIEEKCPLMIDAQVLGKRLQNILLRVQGSDFYFFERPITIWNSQTSSKIETPGFLASVKVGRVARFMAGLGGISVIKRFAPAFMSNFFDITRHQVPVASPYVRR